MEVFSTLDIVRSIRASLSELKFDLEVGEVARARRRRDQLVRHLDDILIVRLLEVSAPLMIVTAGSTGAGKSTLVNSVIGQELTPAGVLRPTTRHPVILHHPNDREALQILPIFPALTAIATERIAPGMSLIDAPDLDSVVATNRELAERLLGAADLWLFVTTAARYGDALPWAALTDAAARGVAVAVVLNRTAPEAIPDVRIDLARRLDEHGLGNTPLFIVEDIGPHSGLLPPATVEAVRAWLAALISPGRAQAIIRRTQSGSLRSLAKRAEGLAKSALEQEVAFTAARLIVRTSRTEARDLAKAEVLAGAVVSGEIETGWDTVFHSRLRRLIRPSGKLRGRGRTARKRQADLSELALLLEGSVVATLDKTGLAVETEIRQGWNDGRATSGLVNDLPEAQMASDRSRRAQEAAADWRARAHQEVRVLRDTGDTRVVDRVIGAIGAQGLESLVLIAAAGHDGAGELLMKLLQSDGQVLMDILRDDLVARVLRQVDDEAVQFSAVLDEHRENIVALEQLVTAAESLRRVI